MISATGIKLECSFTDRTPEGENRRYNCWADVQDIYSHLALAVRFYPQWCQYAVLKKDDFHYFTLIPHPLVLEDLKKQGYEVIFNMGKHE